MNTDACQVYSVMGYQSWGAAYDHCEAWKSTLVKLEGRLSKGHVTKATAGIRQKAKVGSCGDSPIVFPGGPGPLGTNGGLLLGGPSSVGAATPRGD